jgi:hypothetical protein
MRALIPLLFLLPATAQAACEGQTFISCPVGGGGLLEVCIAGGAFTYAFGPPGAPELQLSVPMAAGTVTPWSGVGRAIWSSVGFPNDGYVYEVWGSVDRLGGGQPPEGGVNVYQGDPWNGGTLVGEHMCQGLTVDPVFVLEDAMAAAGYCWDRSGSPFRWLQGGCE